MLSVLIEGWIKYPHSYAIVNVYQILSLLKKGVKVYIKEQPAYNEEWKRIDDLTDILLTKEENDVINNLPVWKEKTEIDCIFRICYPYDLSPPEVSVPVAIFYTSEFGILRDAHFDKGTVKTFTDKCFSRQLIPVTPSKWSADALINHKYEPLVIPHGVDVTKYYPLGDEERYKFREECNIPRDAFVFLTVGAMTGNKNIKGMIKAVYRLSHLQDNIYLVLKGIGNLYNCEKYINDTVKELISEGTIIRKHWRQIKYRLIYIGDLFGYSDLCKLYNSADCYLSPYVAEGFNIPVLEALACGIPVIVSKGGSTDDFTNDVVAKYPRTVFATTKTGEKCLLVDDVSLQENMMNVISDKDFRETARIQGPIHVKEKYTWDIVTERLYNFLNFIVPDIRLSKTDTHRWSPKCKP